ncbi:MAG: thioredoxin [Woeseiaceae bacterium]
MTEATNFDVSDQIVNVTARDFDEVVAKADIPVLVDFWAPWCGPCQQIAPVLEALVGHYPGKIRVAKVNVDEETTLATGFNVRSIPMLLLFKSGKVVEEIIGLQSPEDLINKIAPHIAKPASGLRRAVQDALLSQDYATALPLLEQALVEEPNNAGIKVDIARSHAALGDADAADAMLSDLPETIADDPEVEKLRHEINLVRQSADTASPEVLLEQLASNPDDLSLRHELARAYLATRNYEQALAQFFELMKSDREFQNDAGREGLLSVFGLLGSGDPRVQDYRRKMSNLLN